jgi:hypothetical protein
LKTVRAWFQNVSKYARMASIPVGDGRPADGQIARELPDGLGPAAEALEDRPARRVAEGGEAVDSVSRH